MRNRKAKAIRKKRNSALHTDPLIEESKLNLSSDSVLRFPLARLQSFDPHQFFGDSENDEINKFMLTLALVYNDFKSTMTYQCMIEELTIVASEKPSEPNKHTGQFSGMANWIFRMQIGILCELVALVKANKDAFKCSLYKKTISKMKDAERQRWSLILQLAGIESPIHPFTEKLNTFLIKARSHGGFHYYQNKPLKKGYVDHFRLNTSDLHRSFAYLSVGKSFEESRYYFADAAITQQMLNLYPDGIETDREFLAKFEKYVEALHVGIRYLISSFLSSKEIELKIENV